MGDPASRQEQVLREFTKITSGSQQVFHPDLYGRTAKEPADLAIVTGRLALVFYMKDSRLGFDKLVRKNLSQARTWLRRWSLGEKLRGKNEWREFDVTWDDIDDIVVVSVLDGPEAACLAHPTAFAEVPKVALAVTIAGECLFRLAEKSGGTRDLLAFLEGIAADGEKVSPSAAVEMLAAMQEAAFAELTKFLADRGQQTRPSDVITGYLHSINLGTKADPVAQKDLNLDWSDLATISRMATASIDMLAPFGKFGPIVCGAIHRKRRYAVVAAVSIEALAERFDDCRPFHDPDLPMVFYFYLLGETIAAILTISTSARLSCDVELNALRAYKQPLLPATN